MVRIELVDPAHSHIGEVDVRPPFHIPRREVKLLSGNNCLYRFMLRPRRGAFHSDEFSERLGDVPVGSLPILCNNGQGGLVVKYITIPPPAPFREIDIDTMWNALTVFPASVPRSVRRDTTSPVGSTSGIEPSLAALPRLIQLAAALVHRWPNRETAVSLWRPVDVPGGREDARTTLGRIPNADIITTSSEARLPSRTARLLQSSTPWRLASLAAVLRRVRANIRSRDWTGTIPPGDRILSEVIAKSEPLLERAIDPPLSSWPSGLRELYDAALDFISGSSAASRGKVPAPLCHIWALYESWVGSQLFGIICDKFGSPDYGPDVTDGNGRPGASWCAKWSVAGGNLHLWCQPEFREGAAAGCPPIVSHSAVLIPDILIGFQDHRGMWRHSVIDAKFRGDRKMSSGALSEAASKYLWGLRRLNRPDQFALQGVLVVASAGTGEMFDCDTAAISGIRATPTYLSELDSTVSSLIDALRRPSQSMESPQS